MVVQNGVGQQEPRTPRQSFVRMITWIAVLEGVAFVAVFAAGQMIYGDITAASTQLLPFIFGIILLASLALAMAVSRYSADLKRQSAEESGKPPEIVSGK